MGKESLGIGLAATGIATLTWWVGLQAAAPILVFCVLFILLNIERHLIALRLQAEQKIDPHK